jgi:two-component system phosphate regulon sensor histidine kinase PhoR
MAKTTLTALAWRQSWVLWGLTYAAGLGIGYAMGGNSGLVIAFIFLTTFQIIRSYLRLGRILEQLESRALNPQPEGQGVWAALETLIYKKNREHRVRIGRLVEMLRGYRLAAGAMPEGALVVSRESGYIVWSNKTAKRMLGLHPGDEDANLFRLFDADVKNWFMSSDSEKTLLNVTSPGERPWALALTVMTRLPSAC